MLPVIFFILKFGATKRPVCSCFFLNAWVDGLKK
jgi:hypothetical protein